MKVSKNVYILCALFLGGFGVHKLIAGKQIQFLLMLGFCWTLIPAIIGVIDALLAAGKSPDESGRITV